MFCSTSHSKALSLEDYFRTKWSLIVREIAFKVKNYPKLVEVFWSVKSTQFWGISPPQYRALSQTRMFSKFGGKSQEAGKGKISIWETFKREANPHRFEVIFPSSVCIILNICINLFLVIIMLYTWKPGEIWQTDCYSPWTWSTLI